MTKNSLANIKQKKDSTSCNALICVDDKRFRVAETSSLFNNYRIYVEENPKILRRNHVAAMVMNQEIVFGEAIVVSAKVKGPWARVARSVDFMEFMQELMRLKPTLVNVFHEASNEEGGIIIPYSTKKETTSSTKMGNARVSWRPGEGTHTCI